MVWCFSRSSSTRLQHDSCSLLKPAGPLPDLPPTLPDPHLGAQGHHLCHLVHEDITCDTWCTRTPPVPPWCTRTPPVPPWCMRTLPVPPGARGHHLCHLVHKDAITATLVHEDITCATWCTRTLPVPPGAQGRHQCHLVHEDATSATLVHEDTTRLPTSLRSRFTGRCQSQRNNQSPPRAEHWGEKSRNRLLWEYPGPWRFASWRTSRGHGLCAPPPHTPRRRQQ